MQINLIFRKPFSGKDLFKSLKADPKWKIICYVQIWLRSEQKSEIMENFITKDGYNQSVNTKKESICLI
jgi:hypothetical protein